MLSYDQVKDKPTILLAFTGQTLDEFEELLVAFTRAWQQITREEKLKCKSKRKSGGGRKPQLKTMSERLFFILFYLKTYPIQEVLAFLFGISQGQANYWIHRCAKTLKRALSHLGHLAERDGTQLANILYEYEPISFTQDATERRRQRPQDNDKQQEYYSGKKKTHTVKNHLVIQPDSHRICYLSATVPGKKHDKKLADESNLFFPPRAIVEQDTGFQGFSPEQITVLQPKKKPRGKDLTFGEQVINRCIASSRIVVENVIAGVKRCRIVKDVLRNWKSDFDDLVMELACGLHNLRVAHRSPVETINLIDFYFQ